jgi:arginyl-tRNA synthetase
VRSNGTVTYVGKDIAYQLWKFGLLGRDFGYRRFYAYQNGHVVWTSAAEGAEADAPPFGRATDVFNVIDTRQSYLQSVVVAGLRALGFEAEAARSVHFSYEIVALSPRCAADMGYTLSEEDARKPYVEVSGRKGLGVKADDLLDRLEAAARAEVDSRHPEAPETERGAISRAIAVGRPSSLSISGMRLALTEKPDRTASTRWFEREIFFGRYWSSSLIFEWRAWMSPENRRALSF